MHDENCQKRKEKGRNYYRLSILVEVHMKKAITSILITACLLSSSACIKAGVPEESVPSETTVESTEEAEITTTESSEPESSVTVSEETSETTPTDSSSASTDATTSTTASKPVVKVTTAEKKSVKFDSGKVAVNIPQVTISGIDTSSVNSQIKKDINKKKWGAKYSYYANDKIVSILVELEGEYDSDFERKVYNISVSTGKIMSDSDVVKLFGSTDKKFFAQIKKAYKKDRFGVFKGIEKQTDLSKKKANKLLTKLRNKNLKRISYKYVDPYINSKGKLKWVSSRYVYDVEYGDSVLVYT